MGVMIDNYTILIRFVCVTRKDESYDILCFVLMKVFLQSESNMLYD